MFRRSAVVVFVLVLVIAIAPMTSFVGAEEAKPIIGLSPQLKARIRAEMAELYVPIQGIALSLAKAEWESI